MAQYVEQSIIELQLAAIFCDDPCSLSTNGHTSLSYQGSGKIWNKSQENPHGFGSKEYVQVCRGTPYDQTD